MTSDPERPATTGVPDSAPELAAVVIALGAPASAVDAVRSLLAQDPPVEIVVVNSGGGGMASRLRQAGIDVPVIEREERLFAGAVRNLGIAATTAPYVGFLASDCRAAPGWSRNRLRMHRAGHAAVASAVLPSHPGSAVAWASHIALFRRRLPRVPAKDAALYGASYRRSLFELYGLFREDLRVGEDTEFHARLPAEHQPVWCGRVRAIHNSPTRFSELLADQYARGARMADSALALRALRIPFGLRWCYTQIRQGIRQSRAWVRPRDAHHVRRAWFLLPFAVAAYAAGGAVAHRRREGAVSDPISRHLFPRAGWLKRLTGRRPAVVAAFSFRYDAHLVPDLIANLRPIVDGYVAYDDRGSTDLFSDERKRRQQLLAAAKQLRSRWILFIDPDERLEAGAAERIHELTRAKGRIVWGFRLRELYAPDAYRVDGLWGRKVQYRLFPLLEGQRFAKAPLHAPPHPKGYRRRDSGLNLYHLKMITPARRTGRRDLYKALDPDNACQAIGYDYLADEEGAVLKRIPPRRRYRPEHVEDGGLWMPAVKSGRER